MSCPVSVRPDTGGTIRPEPPGLCENLCICTAVITTTLAGIVGAIFTGVGVAHERSDLLTAGLACLIPAACVASIGCAIVHNMRHP